MTSKKRKKNKPAAKPREDEPLDDEDRDIIATRRAIQPLLDAGMSHFRLASAAGAHPVDMIGFLEGRVSLTPMLRARLRAQIPDLLDSLRPRG